MFNDVEHDGDMDEFHNPAYMVGDDEAHGAPSDVRHTSPHSRFLTTNFTNPVYESGPYNDTVIAHAEDLPDVIPSVVAISTISTSNSEKKKLLGDPLTDIQ